MKWQRRHTVATLLFLAYLLVLACMVFLQVFPQPSPCLPPSTHQRYSPDGPSPGPYPYIINQVDKCPEESPAPFLVLLIPSQAHEVEARDAIRQTWASEDLGVARLFLLGVKEEEEEGWGDPVPEGGWQKTLEAESLRHRDILQQDFADTYHNLTVKTLMGMSWVAQHCPRAAYAMKADSDVFVNTHYLVHKLLRPELEPRTGYMTGFIVSGGQPIRDKSYRKYYMPPEEYPGETYPDYCSGTGYAFSGDMAARIYNASLSVPLLRFEDVYVGVCLEWLGIKATPPPVHGLFYPRGEPYSDVKYSNMVISHNVRPREILDYWHRLQRYKLSMA